MDKKVELIIMRGQDVPDAPLGCELAAKKPQEDIYAWIDYGAGRGWFGRAAHR